MLNNQPQLNPYPIDAFHHIGMKAISEVADIVKVPVPMSAISALTAMTVSVQGLIRVELPTGQVKSVSQNFAFLGESGDRKSAVDDLFGAYFKLNDEKNHQKYSEAMKSYCAKKSVWEAKATGLRRKIAKAVQNDEPIDALCNELEQHEKDNPIKPRLRRTVRTDISERALMEALEGDGESIAVINAEGQLVLKNVAFSQSTLFNKTWDSGTLIYDRANECIIAVNPAVSVSFMVQPDVFREFVEKHGKMMRGSGAWARYLFAWPQSLKGFRFMTYTDPVWKHLPKFIERVSELLEERDQRMVSGNFEFDIVGFTDEAKYRYIDEVNYIEGMLQPCGYLNDISDFASKAMEISGRLAAAMHRFNKQEGKITVDTLERAIAIMVWHLEEFKRIFSSNFDIPQVQLDAQALENYFASRYLQMNMQVALRNDVLRNGPVRPKDRFDAALDLLVAMGRIRVGTDHKKKRYIDLNTEYFGFPRNPMYRV